MGLMELGVIFSGELPAEITLLIYIRHSGWIAHLTKLVL